MKCHYTNYKVTKRQKRFFLYTLLLLDPEGNILIADNYPQKKVCHFFCATVKFNKIFFFSKHWILFINTNSAIDLQTWNFFLIFCFRFFPRISYPEKLVILKNLQELKMGDLPNIAWDYISYFLLLFFVRLQGATYFFPHYILILKNK